MARTVFTKGAKPLGGSKIGRRVITLPAGVEVRLEGYKVIVKSSKGELFCTINSYVTVKVEGNELRVTPVDPYTKEGRSFHGLFSVLIGNMVTGLSVGYTRILLLVGTGYRAKLNEEKLEISLGYSHPVIMEIPLGIKCAVEENNTKIILTGIDKEAMGQFAADIRKKRSPEPYKGKGIRYENEVVRKKAGKSGKSKK